jgi:hypothetical protein
MKSFKVAPVYLSPEHAKQAEKFTGFPPDPVGDAAGKSWALFKQHQHQLHASHTAARRTTSRKSKR